MSEQQTFAVKTRNDFGTGAARAARNSGVVPGILYGDNKNPIGISLDPKALNLELEKTGFFSRVYTLDVDGKKETVIAKALQRNPITDNPIHIDFMRVTQSSKVSVRIPVKFINADKSTALKRGGSLNIVKHALEITAAVKDIPESFIIDLSAMDLSKGIRLDHITMPAGVIATNPKRDHTLATVKSKRGKQDGSDEDGESEDA